MTGGLPSTVAKPFDALEVEFVAAEVRAPSVVEQESMFLQEVYNKMIYEVCTNLVYCTQMDNKITLNVNN